LGDFQQNFGGISLNFPLKFSRIFPEIFLKKMGQKVSVIFDFLSASAEGWALG